MLSYAMRWGCKMNKRRRNYIKENGRTSLREMSNRRTPSKPIFLDNTAPISAAKQIGSICKVWSSIYCTWVWEATLKVNGLIIRREYCEALPDYPIKWARDKYEAINNPRFARLIQKDIAESDFTIQDIADTIGITKNAISKWISGEVHPTCPYLVRLCKMLYGFYWESHYLEFSKILDMERV